MPGHIGWTGNFLHGVFYAAVDPQQEYAAEYIKRCIELDGHLLTFIEETEIREQVQQYCDNHFKNRQIDTNKYDISELWPMYVKHIKKPTTEIQM